MLGLPYVSELSHLLVSSHHADDFLFPAAAKRTTARRSNKTRDVARRDARRDVLQVMEVPKDASAAPTGKNSQPQSNLQQLIDIRNFLCGRAMRTVMMIKMKF